MNKSSRYQRIKKLLILFIVLITGQVHAQLYPVSVTTQVHKPYSVRLSQYTTSIKERLTVTLNLLDVNDFNRKVRLKLIVKRNNQVFFTSGQVVTGAPFITLSGGESKTFTNLDLGAYFRLENLHGISPQMYHQPLPDGLYQFCFEVYDLVSGKRLSKPGGDCDLVHMVLHDPPVLNFPRAGDVVSAQLPQNIDFNWTPRGIAPSNVEYEFTLKELWDTQIDPRAAFQASAPLYQAKTFGDRSFLYNDIAPQLIDGKTYGWQVRAFVSDGIEETALYKNNGYSEIFWFTYLSDCAPPDFILAEAISTSSERITWQQNLDHLSYRLQYRKVDYKEETEKQRARREKRNKRRAEKGKDLIEFDPERVDYEWYEVNSRNPYATIHNLEAGTTYEYRVGGQCHVGSGFSYSDPREFTTPTPEESTYYNCGLPPEVTISNKSPLQNLGVNETFTAGDFPVTVKEVRGENGRYSGWGFIVVPYLADTKIRVVFNDVQINTDYQLIQGEVETAYDANWSNVHEIKGLATLPQDIQDIVNGITDLLNNWTGTPEEIAELQTQKGKLDGQLDAVMDDPSVPEAVKEGLESTKEGLSESVDTLTEKSDSTEEDKEKVTQAVQKTVDKLNELESGKHIESNNEVIAGDGYFDGVINFSINSEKTIQNIDGKQHIQLDELKKQDKVKDTLVKVALKPNKRLLLTQSDTGSLDDWENVGQAKAELANIGADEYLLWLHYDYGKNQVKYKVAFGSNYFKGTSLARDDLVDLYNTILAHDYEGSIGSAVVTATEAMDRLLEEYKGFIPYANDELIAGLTTYEILKIAVGFAKHCGNDISAAPGGIVPKCLWQDQNTNPAMAYYAGFIDGAWEIIPTTVAAGKFLYAWQPLNNSYYWTPEAIQTRQQTIELLLLMEQLHNEDALYDTLKQQFGNEFDKYIDETVALDAQARYNQGKLIFEVASFFFGVAEAKAALKTGKITSETFQMLKKIPSSMASFIKSAARFSKKVVLQLEASTGKLLLDGQHFATIIGKRIRLVEVITESIAENLKPIGQLVTPEGYTLIDDNKSLGERVLNIVEDAKGKYRVAVAKAGKILVNTLDDFTKLSLKQRLDYLKEAWKAYYPQIFFERKLFEDMMGYYRYKKSLGWGHTGDIAHNFKAIDFYNDFTKVGDDVFAETVVSMKTTTTTNVDNWLASNPVKSNLDNLEIGKLTGDGVSWNGTTIKYNVAEVHIYMPQANINPQLKTKWLTKLATERPEITFKINALEDFVN
ncbi:fibronectin type III domain-containing protein [Galbibacter sp. EGI 63066]|uniref:fibronectin type III domain-containing protein n=1 Tax=Galbibacter sp. EGI 63066 TaxID=2993559 RepID=UPI0022494E79|nr:fibronectin type III domain-containing protein [Galbibacter sp. EGI 63066]MCX2682130.1 fibronectin type III domain-containing protein [Galbibacter sp. EGI 63066]